jgi:exopolysaccharide biosynthesis polyprenyl glycosylphosphotransferase
MIRRHATALRLALAGLDGLAALAVLWIAVAFRFRTGSLESGLDFAIDDPVPVVLAYVALWPLALWTQGLYRLRARWTIRGEFLDVVRATVIFAGAVLSLLFLFKLPDVSRSLLIVVFPALGVSALASRVGARTALRMLRLMGRNTRHLLVLGTTARSQEFADLVESHPALGLRVVGHLTTDGHDPVTRPVLGSLDEIEAILHSMVIDEVAICLPVSQWSRIDEIARLCEEEGKIVRIPMYVLEHTLSEGKVEDFEGVPIYSIVTGPNRVLGLLAKRAFDLVGGLFLVALLSPLMAAIAIAIARDTPGQVLFRQQRVGLHGRSFEVLKFRTMTIDAERQLADLVQHNEVRGHAFKMTDDPRVTRVGGWLRRTSLDELPQLWNVLKGQMSLVGPRPPLPAEVSGYDAWHRRRLSMKPGMTGLWQVRARRESDFDRWVETDLEYIDSWSLWLDFKIMALTIPAVLARTGR